jgi:DNA-directed RNA polymerase specialized sigma24 family protein
MDAPAATMPAPALPSEIAAEWPELRLSAFAFALRLCRNEDRANELVQEAVRRALEQPWDRTRVTLLGLLCGFIRTARFAERRHAAKFPKTFLADESGLPSTDADPEGLFMGHEEREVMADVIAEARVELDGDDLAIHVLDLWTEGLTDAKDQANALGLPATLVYNARKRMQYAVERVLERRRRR